MPGGGICVGHESAQKDTKGFRLQRFFLTTVITKEHTVYLLCFAVFAVVKYLLT